MASKDLFPDFNPKYPDFMEDKRILNRDETEFAMENYARLPQSVKSQLIQSGQAPQQYMTNKEIQGKLITYNLPGTKYGTPSDRNLMNQTYGTGTSGIGASQTTSQDLARSGVGSLPIASYMPQAQALLGQLSAKTPEEKEREDRINTGLMFLNFFTKMGAEASKPGATALGAANIAGADTAKMYIDRINAERKRKSDERKSALNIALQLQDQATKRDIALGKIKPKYVPIYKDGSVTNVIENSDEYIKKITQENWQLTKPAKSPGFTYKSVDAGIPAIYVTTEDAEKLLEPYVQNGLDPNSNAYKKIIKAITVPSDKPGLLGKEVIINDMYAMIKPVQIGEKIGDVVIQGNKDAPAPNFVEFKKEYSKKYGKDFQGTVATYAEVIPKIQSAMDILIKKGGPDTGKLAEFTLPFKQIINQAFGNTDPGVRSLESLQSIAFYLATKMRPKGSGSTSDMEFRAYMKAALSLANSPEANYISLYAMKKMKENAEIMNEEAFRLIDSGEVRSVSELNSALKKKDTGLFKKFDFSKFDGEVRDSNGQFTSEFIEARNQWENTLDAGDVVISTGVYDGDSPYRIIDWRKN